MKYRSTLIMILLCATVYCQKYDVSKTEVLIDTQNNTWSQTTENAFIDSVTLIPDGSLEIALPNKETVFIYKLEISKSTDKNGDDVKTFVPPLIRGTNSEIEITFISGKPAFAYGHSKGWNRNKPNELVIFRFWF